MSNTETMARDGEIECRLHGKGFLQQVNGLPICVRCREMENSGPFGSHKSYELSDTAQLGKAPNQLVHGLGQSMFHKLRPDEPCFILRGQDMLAPTIVRMWCELQVHNPTCPPEKVRQAREIALAMERYPNRKYPD